jgi:hypothetical protein
MEEGNKVIDEAPTEGLPQIEEESPAWIHLAPRAGSWRRQFYLKERNVTVGQLISTIRANKYSLQIASENLDLPEEALREAMLYYEQNKELIQREAATERQALAEKGFKLEPPPLS